ncbi:MAG: metallophosphoesterase [Elusimicrobiota bacterium]
MKIGIMADSHENMDMIEKAVEVFNKAGVETVLHAGDIISPITFKEFKKLNCHLICVYGNNDGEKEFLKEKFKGKGEFHRVSYEGEFSGLKVLMMHEPRQIEALAASQRYDVIIYGHTHREDLRTQGKTLIVNPGECGGWLEGKNTVIILELPSKKVEVVDLKRT